MNIPYRLIVTGLGALVFSGLLYGYAQAGGGHYYAPVTDTVVQEECGACHMAYAPAMLPARSWQRMMAGLDQHFGDNASLDAATAARVGNYLATHAADAPGQPHRGAKLVRGLPGSAAPLRISELPGWVNQHRKVSAREWADPAVRSKANCSACHTAAPRGYYED